MRNLDIRELMAMTILLAFVGALIFAYSESLEKTLENVLMIAVGYYLGSSKGSGDKNQQIERLQRRKAKGG